jgi:hypothetical protein
MKSKKIKSDTAVLPHRPPSFGSYIQLQIVSLYHYIHPQYYRIIGRKMEIVLISRLWLCQRGRDRNNEEAIPDTISHNTANTTCRWKS